MNGSFDRSVESDKNCEIITVELQAPEDTPIALKALQERKTVILKLSRLSLENAQRVVDWMAGGTCAIDGRVEWLGEKTFLFTPNCVRTSKISRSLASNRNSSGMFGTQLVQEFSNQTNSYSR